MKIAVFCTNYPPSRHEGGVSHYTQILCRHLSGPGREVLVVTDDAYLGDGSDGPVKVLKFQRPWTRSIRKRMSGKLAARGVDMVNLQYSPPMYDPAFRITWPWMAGRFASCVSFHTLWGGPGINYATAVSLLCGADGIIATNSEIMYLLKRYLRPFLRKTRHIPIGANIEPDGPAGDVHEVFRRYGLDPDMPVIAYFGMSYPGKGMTSLFEATRILLEVGLQIQLLIIGGGISDVARYIDEKRRLTSRLGIEGRVSWTGRIPARDVSALLVGSRLVFLPYDSGVSDRRGTLMAALAHGKAVVTTRPAVPVGLFKNRENMIWPETGDAAALAETVKKVLEDQALLHRLERGARNLAGHYRWPRIADRTKDFFQELVARKKGQRV